MQKQDNMIQLGTKVVEKEGYPELYRILSTVSQSEQYKARQKNELNDDSSSNYIAVNMSCITEKKFFFQLTTVFSEKKPVIIYEAELWDTDENRLIESFSGYEKDVKAKNCMFISQNSPRLSCIKNEHILKVRVIWVNADGSSQKKYTEFHSPSAEIVTNIKVDAPIAKDKKLIKIGYGRDVPGADYSYQRNITSNTSKVKICLPFSGKIEIDGSVFKIRNIIREKEPVGSEYAAYRSKLHLLFDAVTDVEYNNGTFGDKLKLDSDTVVSWEIPYTPSPPPPAPAVFGQDYWNYEADLSRFSVQTTAGLYAVIGLELQYIDNPNVTVRINVAITSKDDNVPVESNSSTLFIPRIQIVWGCFAKNIKILCADGSKKNVQDFRRGDMVMLHEGGLSKVSDIVTGYEAQLVHIATASGKTLEITDSHPVLTERGIVQAIQLSPSDRIACENGQYDIITELYMTDYDDSVYSLILEESGMLIANGLVAGDIYIQNNIQCENSQPAFSEKIMKIIDEADRLFSN